MITCYKLMKMLTPLAAIVLVLACYPSIVSSAGSCGLTTTSSSASGYLSSPTKPGGSGGGFTSIKPFGINTEYPNDMDCTYDINAPLGRAIKLTWERFDLKGYMPTCWPDDYVEIIVGCSRTSIGKYCSINSQRPFDVYSPDTCLRIKFKSSSKDVAKGFLASYTTFPNTYSKLPSPCGNYLKTGSYGTISSTYWPNYYYSTGGSCYWSIQVGKTKSVKIAFMDFNLPYDYGCDDVKVKIKADDDHKSYSRADKTVLDSKCGNKSPFTVTSSEERVYIRFKTGLSNSRYRGFVLGYVLYEPSIHDTGSKVAIIVVCIIIAIIVIGCVVFCYVRRRRAAQRYQHAPAAVPMAPASYPTQPTSVPPPSYGQATTGPYAPPGSQPPPAQAHYPPPGGQPYPPPGGQPYPPPGGQPYPPPGGQPYPPPGQSPYPPPGGQPYPPPGGQPYPPPGGQPYPPQGSAPPYPTTDAPPYPTSGAPPYPPPGQAQPYPPPGQEKSYPPM